MHIQRFIRLLNDNGIPPLVIEDVLNFAVDSKTFNRDKRRDSDIDVSDTTNEEENNNEFEIVYDD